MTTFKHVEPVELDRIRIRVDAARLAIAALPIALGLTYLAWALWQSAHAHDPSWDPAIFAQAVKRYADFSAPVTDIKAPGFNLLGDHFGPVLALFAPLWWVWPSARMLLAVQAVALGVSVFPVARLAVRRLGTLPGVAITAAYGLSFGLLAGLAVGFHPICLAVPLLTFAGEAFAEGRWRAVVLWCLPLLLIKESMALILFGVGAALIVAGVRRLGVATMLLGAASFALLVLVVIPLFNAAGHYDYTSGLGIGDLWRNLHTGAGTKLGTALLTFGVAGFVGLRSPWCLVALTDLAWRFVGTNVSYYGTDWHYGLITMAVVFPAAIDGIARARAGWLRRWGKQVPAAVLAVALALLMYGPVTGRLRPAHLSATDRAAAQAISMIDSGASVEADQPYLSQLVEHARTVYYSGTVAKTTVPDYALFTTDTWLSGVDPVKYLEGQHPGSVFAPVFNRHDVVLLERQ